MPDLTLYHNPRCSKSRSALELLEARGSECTVIQYLKTPLTVNQLKALAEALGSDAQSMMRTGESAYGELALAQATDDQRFEAIAERPELLQRPILRAGDRAVIGRPPERILSLLEAAAP